MFRSGLDAGNAEREVAMIARRMLEGTEDLISGSREIMSRLDPTAKASPGPFAAIEWFWAETHEYPVGDVRQHYSADLLSRLDGEIDAYVLVSRPAVLNACGEIVEMFDDHD